MSLARDRRAGAEVSPIGLSARDRSIEVMRWGLCFAVVAAIQGALAVGYLVHDEPAASNEAPEAAIMIDLPPELALPPAESVESVASSAADEVDAPPLEETPPDLSEAAAVTEAVAEPSPEETLEDLPELEITDAIEPDAVEDAVEDAPVEPVTETVTAEVPQDVAEAIPPDEVTVSDVALPPPPKVQPKPKAPPVSRQAAKPKEQARPAERARPQPQRREASRAAVAGQRASGAGAPDANALRQFMSSVRADIMRQRRSVSAEGGGRTATVRFTIGAGGVLGGIDIAKSSGDPALDAAALAMVRRASPVPPIPAGVGRSSLSTRLPVRFD